MKFSQLLSASVVVLAALAASANAASLAGSQVDAGRTDVAVAAIAAGESASASGMSAKIIAVQPAVAAGAQPGRDRIYVKDNGSAASRSVPAADAAFVKTTYPGQTVEARDAAASAATRGESSKPNRYLMLLAGIGMLGVMVMRRTNG